MKEKETFEVRVSNTSDPAKVATSILIALSQDKDVIVSSVGESIKVATKAVARLKQFNDTGKILKFDIDTQSTKDSETNNEYVVICHKISLLEKEMVKPVHILTKDYDIEEVDYNANLIKSTIEKKSAQGYEYLNALPITESGNTTKVHLIFREVREVV